MFRFRALGTGTIALSPVRACAGYYVEAGEARLLVDCGAGITRRLAELEIDWQGITHVALTHFHLDHHADLPSLLYAFRYGMLPPRTAPLTIIGPVGTADLLQRLAAAYGDWLTAPSYPQVVHEIAPDGYHDLGGAELRACKVPHTEESVAYSISRNGRRIVYTGDTGVSAELGVWARHCDVLVAECSLPDAMAMPIHLTPEQAGDLAALAQPGLLVLTHLYPPVERVDIEAIVRRKFTGPLTLAHDGWATEIEEP